MTRVAVKIIDTASLQLIGTDISKTQRSLQESVRTEVRVLKALCHTQQDWQVRNVPVLTEVGLERYACKISNFRGMCVKVGVSRRSW